MVSYNTGSSYPILNRRKTSLGDKNAGDIVDWSNVNPQTTGSNRQYAIRSIVKKGSLTVKTYKVEVYLKVYVSCNIH